MQAAPEMGNVAKPDGQAVLSHVSIGHAVAAVLSRLQRTHGEQCYPKKELWGKRGSVHVIYRIF